MSVQKQINRARRLSYTDETQYDNTQAVEDFNIIYQDIANTIVNLQEDYFWDFFKPTQITAGQNEYTLPENLTGGFTSLYKTVGISVKYDTNSDYIKAKRISPNNLDNDLDFYAKTQSKFSPVYHISDNSYFIYPTPDKDVTNGLKVYGIKTLADLELASEELFAGKIPNKFHHIISLGMLEFIYSARGMTNEAMNAKARYEVAKQELVNYINPRDYGIMEITTPNLSNLT